MSLLLLLYGQPLDDTVVGPPVVVGSRLVQTRLRAVNDRRIGLEALGERTIQMETVEWTLGMSEQGERRVQMSEHDERRVRMSVTG